MTKAQPPTHVSPACVTRYHGPTDHRGARVSATHCNNRKKRVTLPWDHALGSVENHEAAARALFEAIDWTAELQKRGLLECGYDGGGYVFMVRL